MEPRGGHQHRLGPLQRGAASALLFICVLISSLALPRSLVSCTELQHGAGSARGTALLPAAALLIFVLRGLPRPVRFPGPVRAHVVPSALLLLPKVHGRRPRAVPPHPGLYGLLPACMPAGPPGAEALWPVSVRHVPRAAAADAAQHHPELHSGGPKQRRSRGGSPVALGLQSTEPPSAAYLTAPEVP